MCLKRKGVTWIFILRLNKGNKPRHIPENQYTGWNKYKIQGWTYDGEIKIKEQANSRG